MEGIPQSRLGRFLKVTLWVGFAVTVSIRAVSNTSYLARSLFAPGPNTVGEAGKVYFARKFQQGSLDFQSGDVPPFYPSIHGVLVHAPVGLIGRALEASTTDLYWIGRSISLGLTLLALGLLSSLGRQMGIAKGPLFVGLILWLGTYSITQHTTSYRPDNWLFFLSVLSCWILARNTDGLAAVILLAAIPVAAFHVKAPGIALIGATVMTLLIQGRVARAVLLGLIQAGLLLASIFLIDSISGGGALVGLEKAGDVGMSLRHLLLSLADPLLLFFVLLPGGLLLSSAFRETARLSPVLKVVGVFWLVTAVSYGAAAARAGSNTYYFLEPASFGMLIGLTWLSAAGRVDSRRKSPFGPYVLAATLLGLPSALVYLVQGHPTDIALFQTRLFAEHRVELADHMNEDSTYCFTDDPGLNVLLRRPAVIHPLLLLQQIEVGTLKAGQLTESLRSHEYDCIVLTGTRWYYRGIQVMPDSFYEVVAEEYPSVEEFGGYLVRRTR